MIYLYFAPEKLVPAEYSQPSYSITISHRDVELLMTMFMTIRYQRQGQKLISISSCSVLDH